MLKRARPNAWVKIGTSLLALGFALAPMRPSLASSITFTPVADSYVNQSYPNNNYGSAASLRTDAAPAVYRSFVQFVVNGVGASITRATLRLYANSANGTGFTALAGTDNSWNEKTITYANQPALGVSLGGSPPYAAGTWSAVDVTPQVRGNGTFTFEIVTSSSTMTNFASREAGAHAPQLVVETANTITSIPAPAPSPTIAAPAPALLPPPPLPSPPQTTQTSGDVQPAFPIRAAFYYPWFPEAWTQLGIYPYTNYNPSLGFYNGADPGVIAKQIAAMRYGGIEAGIASWWGQGTHTDRKIATLLQAAAGTPFRWSIYYENESLGNPSVSQINADLTYIRDHYGKDRSFLRVGGKFVVFVYSDGVDGCGMADRWRQANTVGAYIVLKVFPGYQSCSSQPQGWHQYSPAVPESNQAPYSYSIAPGFYKTREAVRLARNLSTFTQSVRNMVASRAAFHLVTTFNEWGEGTSVESAREWASSSGYGTYLDALHAYGGGVAAASAPAPAATQTVQTVPPASSSGDPVIAAAGDIACDPASGLFNGGNGTATNCRQRATSDLLLGTGLAGVLTLGDLQYENGSLSNFQSSFAPSWGRVKSLIHPAVGNHEYLTSGASGYYSYFGAAAGAPSKGYYSYDIGAWHLIALNSNCSSAGGCGTGSAQEQWLKADLAAHPASCTLAYWHHPRFSSGQHGNNTAYDAFWRDLYAARADLVLVGHDHDYERFAPQDPSERADPNGIRQFVVGTGGKNHYGFSSTQPTSEVRNDNTYGVLRLTLHPNSYDWRFVPEPGKTFSDAGTGSCH